MYDKNALERKIQSMYPEVGVSGIDFNVYYDAREKIWYMDLKKEGHHLKTHLEAMEADSCMEGKECVHMGFQIVQLVENIKKV